LKCSTADNNCLLSKNVDDILQAQLAAQQKWLPISDLLAVFLPFTPTIDGDEITENPVDAVSSGKFNKVPIIMGTVADEGILFIYQGWPTPLPWYSYDAVIGAIFGIHALKVGKLYPTGRINDTREQLSRLAGDYIFTCSTRSFAKKISEFNIPVYLYNFNHSISFNSAWGNTSYAMCKKPYAVCHASELPFVFHTANYGGYNYTNDEEALSKAMSSYWTNFAVTGNPNKGAQSVTLNWVTYNSSADMLMYFTTPQNLLVNDLRKQYCDYFDSISYFSTTLQ